MLQQEDCFFFHLIPLFNLFIKSKKNFSGKYFADVEEIKDKMNTYFTGIV